MYKLLIIDDEEPIRQAIHMLGDWQALGIDAFFEASNGMKGLEIMKRETPEIVLVDMKMPIISGVDFLKTACLEYPDVKYIIISGYDDFTYTKNAIKTNVLDYILKPVNRVELSNALERAVNEIQQGNTQKNQAFIKQNIDILSKAEIKDGQYLSILPNTKKLINHSCCDYVYCVSLFEITNYKNIIRKELSNKTKTIYSGLAKIIADIFSPMGWTLVLGNVKRKNEIVIINGIKHNDLESLKRKFKTILDKAALSLNVNAIIGVGSVVNEIELLADSIDKAEIVIRTANILVKTNRAIFSPEQIGHYTRTSLLDKGQLVIRAFESGNISNLSTLIKDYFESKIQSGYFSYDDALKTYEEFHLLIENILCILKISNSDEIQSIISKKTMEILCFYEEYFREFENISRQLFTFIQKCLDNIDNSNIYEIKRYIDESYFQNISLKYFSEKYHFTKEYISRIFKNEFGYGIYEYVLKTRIEKACELIENKELKIKEISDMVGFNNCNYFSKAFKRFTGYSPLQYRELDNNSNIIK